MHSTEAAFVRVRDDQSYVVSSVFCRIFSVLQCYIVTLINLIELCLMFR